MQEKEKMKVNKKTITAFKWIVNILKKHRIPFQISGGFAGKIYGSKRPVHDIDIDLPENRFREILTEVKKYIIFGPSKYKSDAWDLYLMTLDYKGQLIDIGGSEKEKVCDIRNCKWRRIPTNFSTAKEIVVFGKKVPVIDPKELIEYKSYLCRHQVEDIRAAKNYIKHHKR
jgi:hypothetical protein